MPRHGWKACKRAGKRIRNSHSTAVFEDTLDRILVCQTNLEEAQHSIYALPASDLAPDKRVEIINELALFLNDASIFYREIATGNPGECYLHIKDWLKNARKYCRFIGKITSEATKIQGGERAEMR
jgi:bisphosphoglycerate-dependent phosphoglycerate mutase